MSKGGNRIIVQSSNDFSKAVQQLLNKTDVTCISHEEISSRISEVIHWSLTKSESLGLCKNNIHIFTCIDVHTVEAFKHSGREKLAEFSYKTDESIKSTIGGCIVFGAILLLLEYLCFLRFIGDIFDVVFLLFCKCKN